MSANTGGPAFPVEGFVSRVLENGESMLVKQEGMTLRDYFAAKAMACLCEKHWESVDDSDIAVDAYCLADAMIEERDK